MAGCADRLDVFVVPGIVSEVVVGAGVVALGGKVGAAFLPQHRRADPLQAAHGDGEISDRAHEISTSPGSVIHSKAPGLPAFAW